MSKPRSDSTWAKLSTEQQQTLEGWLFEESLSYAEIIERAQKEFGVKFAPTTLSRLYNRLATDRKLEHLPEIETWLQDDKDDDEDEINRMETAVRKLLTIAAYEMALAGPKQLNTRELRRVMKILLESRRQSTRENRLAMEERKAVVAASKELLNITNEKRRQEGLNKYGPELFKAQRDGGMKGVIDYIAKFADHDDEDHKTPPPPKPSITPLTDVKKHTDTQ